MENNIQGCFDSKRNSREKESNLPSSAYHFTGATNIEYTRNLAQGQHNSLGSTSELKKAIGKLSLATEKEEKGLLIKIRELRSNKDIKFSTQKIIYEFHKLVKNKEDLLNFLKKIINKTDDVIKKWADEVIIPKEDLYLLNKVKKMKFTNGYLTIKEVHEKLKASGMDIKKDKIKYLLRYLDFIYHYDHDLEIKNRSWASRYAQ